MLLVIGNVARGAKVVVATGVPPTDEDVFAAERTLARYRICVRYSHLHSAACPAGAAAVMNTEAGPAGALTPRTSAATAARTARGSLRDLQ